jgi:HPt (histidine-containing phosphotransfer) domain-containing protein
MRTASAAGAAAGTPPPPPHEPPARPVLDPSRLAELRNTAGEGGDGFVEAVVAVFLEEAPSVLASLRQAATRGDLARVQHDAHSLKGASANIGALELQALAAALEARAGRHDSANLDDEVTRLEAAFARVQAALQRHRGAPAPPDRQSAG